jgi:hypothetical protein
VSWVGICMYHDHDGMMKLGAGVMYLLVCTLKYKYEEKSLSLSLSVRVSMSVGYMCKGCTIYPTSFSIRFSSDSKCLTCTPDSHALTGGSASPFTVGSAQLVQGPGPGSGWKGTCSTAEATSQPRTCHSQSSASTRFEHRLLVMYTKAAATQGCRKMHGAIQLRAR